MLPDMMRFRVFHSTESTAQGSEFRVLYAPPKVIDFPEEYAVVSEIKADLSATFYQQGKEFEFCGAGALCLASMYTSSIMPILVTNKHMSFKLQYEEQGPSVCLPLIKAEYAAKESCYLFVKQKVIVESVANQQAVADYNYAPDPGVYSAYTTRIVVFMDNDKLRIVFRYFTNFNNKGEDQATGSVFRYIGVLPIQEETWYDVYQHSEFGAEMRCYKKRNSLVYTGNVTLL